MTTKYNADAIKTAAQDLGRIMDDMSAFAALQANPSGFGNFDLAQLLARITADRADGIVAHGGQLQAALHDMEATLTRITEEYENLDGANAESIKSSLVGLHARVREDLAELERHRAVSDGEAIA